jgi:choline dehydrogenase-like flavoprotein
MVSMETAVAPAASAQVTRERAERRLAIALRVLAGLLLVGAVVYVLGPLVGPAREFFREPPFVSNSAVKVTLIALTCLYAAGDVRRRAALVLIVIAAHLVSIAAMASMLLFADTGRAVDLGFAEPALSTVLWVAMAPDGAIAIVLGALALPARLARNQPDAAVLTPVERRVRTLMIAFAVVFALGAAAYEAGPLLNTSEAFFRELPFVTNSVVKVSMLAMLCGYAASSPRRNLALITPIVAVHVLSVVVSALYLAVLDTGYTVPLLGGDVRMTDVLWGALALDGTIAVLWFLVARSAWRDRYGLKFFSPAQIRALTAVADVLVAGEHERVPPEAVARNVDRQVAEIRAQRRWLYKVCLAGMQARPVLELQPPLSEIGPEARRRFLETRFRTPPPWPPFLKHLTQIMIRICQQLSFGGYYGDRRSFESIGYKPFSERDRFPGLEVPEPGPHPLKVDRPETIGVKELEADICIIGSGAGGGILAYELAKAHPDCKILVLERGQYVEPRHFTEDEVGMIGRLYADGLMQQTEDWRFTVLQGSCVGGSTTVNNAVCFDPPPPALARWNDPHGSNAGLDLGGLRDSVAAVRSFLTVTPQRNAVLNPSGPKYLEGAGKVPAGRLDVGVVQANIQGCFGSGYCNIGCKWGKKLSMLETALPWAQRDFPDRVRIVADCEVERIITMSGHPKRVAGLRAKLADGRGVNVRARRYVVCAGSVASSYLLLRSGAGRGLPVGKGFSCNMGAPLTADFGGKPLNSYDGLQISHFGIPSEPGFVFETWFNPPVSQALNMPGWFERHFQNMERYDHLMAVGVLVGTASNGRIIRALTGGPGVDFRPQPKDLATLARGLKLLGELLFDAGAARVMVNTWGDDEFTSRDQLGEIDRIAADPDYISLGTGHPQGGNAIGRDPKRGVVGPDFKVHGYDDLYVCDASVFPSSLTVNPQLTVMSLAHYAAQRITV